MIIWTKVTSSNIDALSHEGSVLHVKFKGNAIYVYENVSFDLYCAVLGAESVGKAFNAHIKPLPFSRVVEDLGGGDPVTSELQNRSALG